MEAKSANLYARIEPEVKEQAEMILSKNRQKTTTSAAISRWWMNAAIVLFFLP